MTRLQTLGALLTLERAIVRMEIEATRWEIREPLKGVRDMLHDDVKNALRTPSKRKRSS